MSEQPIRTYLIDPKAPLIVRSGRPFDNQAGTDAARFPPPSTLAGALRTAHAHSTDKPLGLELAQLACCGPLPVRLDDAGKTISLLVPKPADALYFWNADDAAPMLVQATPQAPCAGEGCDLEPSLLPVQLTKRVAGKPADGPQWWAWKDLITFRAEANALQPQPTLADIEARGWRQPEDEVRTHVAIERRSQANEAGILFQTAGMAFLPRTKGKTTFGQDRFPSGRIGVLGRMHGDISAGLITLGGERRLSAIASADDALWPATPEGLARDILKAGGLCLTMLTPALFTGGWLPGWLRRAGGALEGAPEVCPGLKLRLRAAALERWSPHSGWDLAARRPRAGRKMIPAGAVYWFELLEANESALQALWLASVCDDAQDMRDGFALALPQPWTPPATN